MWRPAHEERVSNWHRADHLASAADQTPLIRGDTMPAHIPQLRREFLARRGYLGDVLVLTARMQPIDRALALASKLFVAIIPLSIVVSALVPGTDTFGESVVRDLRLTGTGARATETLFETDQQAHGAVSVLGVLIVLYAMLGYARGLQRLYLDAWEIGPLGVEGWWRRALWTAGYTVYLGGLTSLRALERHAGLTGAYVVTLLALGFVIALWGPWALVGTRVPWRRLVPTAALTATGVLTFSAVSSIVFTPAAFTNAAQRYGLIGIAFALVTWLFLDALVIVMAAIVAITDDRRRHGPPIAHRGTLLREALTGTSMQ
jgi:membrane protein